MAGRYGITPKNEIAAEAVYFSAYYGGGFSRYYPFALATNNLISENLEFEDWLYQRMAFKSYRNNNFDSIFASGGYWFPNVSEQFLGVRFQDNEEQIHYGWIRCSVIDSAEGLIIHDYAYETEINHPIAAGSLESYVDIQNMTANNLNFNVYSFNKTIYIISDKISSDCTFVIYDINGKILNSGLVNAKQIQTTLKNFTGTCVVQIKNHDESIFQKQVVVI